MSKTFRFVSLLTDRWANWKGYLKGGEFFLIVDKILSKDWLNAEWNYWWLMNVTAFVILKWWNFRILPCLCFQKVDICRVTLNDHSAL